MCKRHFHTVETRIAVAEGAYEGETVRLDTQREGQEARRETGRHGHFPWWTLWLIWPLFLLAKWIVVTLAGLVHWFPAAIPDGPLFGFWPIALILLALVLLRRR